MRALVALASILAGCGARSSAVSPELDASTAVVEAGADAGIVDVAGERPQPSPDAGTDVVDTASLDQGGGEIHSCSFLRATAAHRCRRREACGVEAGAADDFTCQGVFICASDYDQLCTRDSECVGVGEGNSCQPCGLWCETAGINGHDFDRWRSDVAAALTLSGVEAAIEAGAMIVCECGPETGACCRAGRCTVTCAE